LNLDFTLGTLDDRITFTRASTATYFDKDGVLQSAASGEARFDYDPSTLAPRGLLIEEQRVNSIRNNTMVGAVAGTPGTVPTNWLISTATGNLTSREIVGTGTENGITYIDVRFVASGASTASIYADSSTGVAASNGQTWTTTFFVKLAGGSLSNVTVQTSVVENDSGGNFLAGANGSAFVPTSAALATQRFTQTRTNTNASTAFEWARVLVTFSGASDITLRIGLPQLEQGAFATSVIPTTTTALTRNADVASMTGTNFSNWYNPVEGGFVAEVLRSGNITGISNILGVSDGTTSNRIRMFYFTNTEARSSTIAAGSEQGQIGTSILSGVLNKVAFGYQVNNSGIVANGGSVATDTSVTVPSGINAMLIGANAPGGDTILNGHIRRIAYYPTRLANAQLQALTA
jgi:hypothetical protein